MFENDEDIMIICEKEPQNIFKLFKMERFDLIDKLLSKKICSVNLKDSAGNDVITRLLKANAFDLVLKYMKNRTWNVNNQNLDGNTFAHYLVSINYMYVVDIINALRKKKNFIPNIKNKNNETILDKAINENYIYTTLKILEDKRFNNIDIVSFKHLYETYIETNKYGKYTKLNNLELIIDSLDNKTLLPTMERLVRIIKENFEYIKEQLINNKRTGINDIINDVIQAV